MKGEATSCADRKRKDLNRSGSVLVQCHFCASSEDDALTLDC